MKLNKLIAAFCFATFATLPAHASLIGTDASITTTGNWNFLDGGCDNITVGAGVDCLLSIFADPTNEVIEIDIMDSSIVFEFFTNDDVHFIGNVLPFTFDVVIDGLTWVDDPTATILEIDSTQEVFGVAGSLGFPNTIGASLTGLNQITLNYGDLDREECPASGPCARLTVDITPEHTVPVPGVLPLLFAGLVGLGISRRR